MLIRSALIPILFSSIAYGQTQTQGRWKIVDSADAFTGKPVTLFQIDGTSAEDGTVAGEITIACSAGKFKGSTLRLLHESFGGQTNPDMLGNSYYSVQTRDQNGKSPLFPIRLAVTANPSIANFNILVSQFMKSTNYKIRYEVPLVGPRVLVFDNSDDIRSFLRTKCGKRFD